MAFTLPGPSCLLGFNVQGDLGPLTLYTSTPGRTVAYLKAPPKEPASNAQRVMRNRFALAGRCWSFAQQEQRDRWNQAARKGGLRIHGYSLWVWYQLTNDWPALATIARQTGISLP